MREIKEIMSYLQKFQVTVGGCFSNMCTKIPCAPDIFPIFNGSIFGCNTKNHCGAVSLFLHMCLESYMNKMQYGSLNLNAKVSPSLYEHVCVYPKQDIGLCSRHWRSNRPDRRSDRWQTGVGGLTAVGDGLTARF
jgi:hypothetical protein